MFLPIIESEEVWLPSEIVRVGKWLRLLDPGPQICIKTAKKSLIMRNLGDWALTLNNFLRSYHCFQEPYPLYFENGLDDTLIIFSFSSVCQNVSSMDIFHDIFKFP